MMLSRDGKSRVSFMVMGILTGALGAGGYFLLRAGRHEDYPVQPTRLFEQVLEYVGRHGVDSLPEDELFRRAAHGLMQELDDEFATIRPAGQEEEFPPDVGGLGLLLSARGGRITVLGVLPDSPAERAGLEAGDQIVEVGEGIQDALGRDVVFAALQGDPGTEVELNVRRQGILQPLQFALTRSEPAGHAVSEAVDLGNGTWYVALGLPGPGVPEALRQTLRRATGAGARSVVLDLRGASGGELQQGVELAGLFLPPRTTVATVRHRSGSETTERTGGAGEFLAQRLVVLVDAGTADAAEILAGALQDNDRALVVGRPSFGRGVTQEEFDVGRGAVLRMSTARWVTPSGRVIQRQSSTGADSNEARPGFRTAAGREVRGGGGIVPDSLVARPRRSEAELAFLRVLGAGLPEYDRIIREVARAIAESGRAGSDRFQPTSVDVERVRERATRRGLNPGGDSRAAEAAYVERMLGDWAVLYALGRPGLVRRHARVEPALRLAVGLTGGAGSAAELLGLADSASAR